MFTLSRATRALPIAVVAYFAALILSGAPPVVAADNALSSGQTLLCGDVLSSGSSGHELSCHVPSPPASYVYYRWSVSRPSCLGGHWTTSNDDSCSTGYGGHMNQLSDATPNGRLQMQHDGNLVLLNGSFTPVWASNTSGNFGAYLNAQDDGNLVIYNASNVPVWSIY